MKYAASRLAVIKPSASAEVSQAAKALRAAGEDVIDLGMGEPDFDTPAHIVEAAHHAALAGETRYPPTPGTAAMKAAVASKFAADNALMYESNEIIVGNGAKQVIFDALLASIELGDEVILCAPHFDSYANAVGLLGGTPVVIGCDPADGFRLTPEKLETAITPRTRWLFLNAPSNPAGAVYDREQLQALGAILDKHPHVLVLSDEIYEKIIFDGRSFVSFAAACPSLHDRTLTVNGVSKAYAMTGWRIGYGGGPAELISAMTTVQSQISSGACSVAQAAATAALTGPQDCVTEFSQAFEDRRNLVVDRVGSIDGLSLVTPGGAFYALIDANPLVGSTTPSGVVLDDDRAFTEHLLADAKVASVPGSVYGTPGFFRISTASSADVLATALDRIAGCVAALRRTS